MTLIEFYPQIRHVHMGLVAASGLLFALRGVGVLTGAGWSMHRRVRVLSQAIDTGLLTAGLLLLYVLRLNPFVSPWLLTKLALLVIYVMLGVQALKSGSSRRRRALFLAAALSVFLFMLSVAVAHHPLGVFHMVS